MEAQIVAALRAELQRQASESPDKLSVADGEAGWLTIDGALDLEALAMAVVGKVAGGP